MGEYSEVLKNNISNCLKEKYGDNFKIEHIGCFRASRSYMDYLVKVKVGDMEKIHEFSCITLENPNMPILFDGELTKEGKAREKDLEDFGKFISGAFN